MKYNQIHIYFRQTSHNKISPTRVPWFDYEKCFSLLLHSINFDLVKLTIVFDGSQEEYNNHFTKKYDNLYKFRVKLIDTKSYSGVSYEQDGSSKSGCLTSRIIKEDNLSPNDLIFILENDYIFRPIDWATITLDLYNNYLNGNYYISLYDHLDKYIFNKDRNDEWGMFKNLENKIMLSSYCHWRETPLICSSWILPKSLFDRDYDLFSIGMSDNTLCGEIKKKYGTKFLSPIPSISTHSESYFLAPYINWKAILNDTQLL